ARVFYPRSGHGRPSGAHLSSASLVVQRVTGKLVTEVFAGKRQVVLPVGADHRVSAGAIVVGDRLGDGLVWRWHLRDAEAGEAEQLIHRAGVDGGEEFAARVGPQVFGGTRHVHRTWGDQRDQFVGVDGEVVFAAVVGLVAIAEPVREVLVDAGDGFAELATRDGHAALAGLRGDDDGEAIVVGAGPDSGFAEARVAHDRDFLRVDVGVGREIVERAAQAPGPGADRAPFARHHRGVG